MTINEASGIKGIHYSLPCVTYHDVVLALKQSGLSIKSMRDLAAGSIAAFQDAAKYLGPEYAKVVAGNPQYREVADQASQVAMLYDKRALMLVCDINIFNYYRLRLKRIDTSAPVEVFELFSPVEYKVGFRDAGPRDAFNQALKELKAAGRDQALKHKYLNQ
jgi:polar amino acid transport system substrate-binding protein